MFGDRKTALIWAEVQEALRAHGVADDMQERRAQYERAVSMFDSGGRWLLPPRWTPEGQRYHAERWVDLGELIVQSVQRAEADEDVVQLWRAWLAGDASNEDAQHQPPRELFEAALGRALQAVADLLADGKPVYVDARGLIEAIKRTRQRWSDLPIEPTRPASALYQAHDALPRRSRGSVLLLLPARPAAGQDELGHQRALWASGR